MQTYGIIMAGGGGTRFWPLSRLQTPKQLLNLSGKDLMLNEAFDRMAQLIPPERIFIVTSAVQADGVLEGCAGRVDREHILAEPMPRSTAACIGYAAAVLSARHGDGLMLITPSDHYIEDRPRLTGAWQRAFRAAESGEHLVTIGIRPTYPSTGYGYIRYDAASGGDVRKVFAFREKPDLETAKAFLADGGYAWNSGMFIWRTDTVLRKLREFAPDIHAGLMKIRDAVGTPAEDRTVAEAYAGIRAVSVDYAVMEPAAARGEVLMVPGDFGWNDVGSWDVMDVLHAPDENGNVRIGDTLAIGTRDCVIVSRDRLVSAVDVEGLVIVQTPDAVMVCRRDRAQNVRAIVDALREAGRTELL